MDYYVRAGQRYLRRGFTTGTCAALAASGAAELLLSGNCPGVLGLRTPGGLWAEAVPRICERRGDAAYCAVVKGKSDDPDVTAGCTVGAEVRKIPAGFTVDGGAGVGRVTKPGLEQPVGAAAINRVPRAMIANALREAAHTWDYGGGLAAVISVPEGAALAERTFNPQLGIVGGISILGTSGIVEPMSEEAMVDALAVEIRQAASGGGKDLILVPGEYGFASLREQGWNHIGLPVIRCSNFIGDCIDLAALEGFRQVLIAGHMGKLVKLAGGMFHTHSRFGDCRRELFCAHSALQGADAALCRALMEASTTEGCLSLLEDAGLREQVVRSLLDAIQKQLDRRSGPLTAGAAVFSGQFGLLGVTDRGREILRSWGYAVT